MKPGLVLAVLAWLPVGAPAAEPADFVKQVRPFFETYCLRCHDEKQHKGDFRLDALPHDFTNEAVAQRWAEVVFRLNAGEMPPRKEPQPRADELGKAVEWITSRLKEGEAG